MPVPSGFALTMSAWLNILSANREYAMRPFVPGAVASAGGVPSRARPNTSIAATLVHVPNRFMDPPLDALVNVGTDTTHRRSDAG
jgi:hypothetical protein